MIDKVTKNLEKFNYNVIVANFSETYNLATFSRKFTNLLNLKTNIDIRATQPKYGFVSERKYILREVIRLKDIPIIFNDEKHNYDVIINTISPDILFDECYGSLPYVGRDMHMFVLPIPIFSIKFFFFNKLSFFKRLRNCF